MSKKNYLILKFSDRDNDIPFGNEAAMTEKANGAWRITVPKVGDTRTALVLLRGQIINEYAIGDKLTYDRHTSRMTFDLTPIDNSKLKNKHLSYKTANPASIMDEDKLAESLTD